MTLDLEFVRARFPGLETPWALLDNAGGSVPARAVIDRVADYMARSCVQHGASYALSREAAERVAEGRRAAATLLGADPGEVVLGHSSTALVDLLARALRPAWEAGDEVVVTNLDHEANVGPWRALEAGGIVVKEWRFDRDSLELELRDLEPLLTERTRLVAFTHCSNVVGTIHDAAAICARIRAARALSCVDGVAFAPHRRVDVRALGADFYFASLYKVYGPHQGALYGRRELLRAARAPNHFFVPADAVPTKLEPGNATHELAAGLPGIVEHLTELDRHHGGPADAPVGERLGRAFERVAAHEAALAAPLLAWLDAAPGVRLLGRSDPDPARRAPTIAFTVDGADSRAVVDGLDAHRVAARYGHFYAYRAVRDLGLLDRNGVVRVSLVHYNAPAEVERLLAALDATLPGLRA